MILGVPTLLWVGVLIEEIAGAMAWEVKIAGMTPFLVSATVLLFGLMIRTLLLVLTGNAVKVRADTSNDHPPSAASQRHDARDG